MVTIKELHSLYLSWLISEEKEYLSEFLIKEAEDRLPGFRKDNMTMVAVQLRNLEKMKDVSASFGCVNQSKKLIANQVYFEFNSDVD